MAVVRIETSNLFDYSSERPDRPSCDAEHVSTHCEIHELGVHVHKYDNGFLQGMAIGRHRIANFINGGRLEFRPRLRPEAPGRFDQGRARRWLEPAQRGLRWACCC